MKASQAFQGMLFLIYTKAWLQADMGLLDLFQLSPALSRLS